VLALSQARADPPLVMRAGEWSTVIGAGPGAGFSKLVCIGTDKVMTPDRLTGTVGKAGLTCSGTDVTTSGNVATYTMTCGVRGGQMTVHGTVTMQGEDSLITRSHSHMVGGTMAMPDMDMVVTQHRTGPCRSGDRPDRSP
jgi:hypothetical protein